MSRLEDKRTWLGGGVVAAVLILAAGWFGVISPQLSSSQSLRSEAGSAETQNGVLAAKVGKLKLESDKAPELRASLRAALAALPFDSGLPAFTRQLSAQAREHHVTLGSIAVGAIASVIPVAAAPAGTTPSTTTTNAPTTGTPAVAAVPVAIPITLSSTGTAKNQLAFLQAIQVTGPRRALVVSTALSPGAGAKSGSIDKASTMNTQLSIFSTPLTAAARAQLEKLLTGK